MSDPKPKPSNGRPVTLYEMFEREGGVFYTTGCAYCGSAPATVRETPSIGAIGDEKFCSDHCLERRADEVCRWREFYIPTPYSRTNEILLAAERALAAA